MLVWMLYVIVVSASLGGAALSAESAKRMRRGSTRWLWGLSMVASLLLPVSVASVSVRTITNFIPTVGRHPVWQSCGRM